jgi:ELWxxDGT repeat protein
LPRHLTRFRGKLFFVANDGAHGDQLWTSDGTQAGTRMVKGAKPARGGKFPAAFHNLIPAGERLYFFAYDGDRMALWKSDGTAAGTGIVKHVNAGLSIDSQLPRPIVNIKDTLFFVASDPKHGAELWKSDGTEAGTVLVKDVRRGPADSQPHVPAPTVRRPRRHQGSLTAMGKMLFFAADDGVHGEELWRSDGTEAGTVMVKDVAPGGKDSAPQALTDVNGVLYFSAVDGAHGRHLWKSDGTEAGTVVVKGFFPDVRKPEALDYLGQLTVTGEALYFVAESPIEKQPAFTRKDLWYLPLPKRRGH